MLYLGSFPASATVYVPFAAYSTAGASATITGLAVTDIEVYKDGAVTQRASDSGYSLLDTDGVDFDSLTGLHGFSIDLSDNTDAGFYEAGHTYWVVVSAVAIDGQALSFVAAMFRIAAGSGGGESASLTLGRTASLAPTGSAATGASMSLARQMTLGEAGSAAAGAVMSLAREATLAEGGGAGAAGAGFSPDASGAASPTRPTWSATSW